MRVWATIALVFLTTLAPPASVASVAADDDFSAVVKLIERFYHVKHQSLPLLARAGIKAVRTAARIRGGEYRRIAEVGSARIAFFEDELFDSRGQMVTFKGSVQTTLASRWSGLVQTLAPKDEEQTYIYIRDAREKFKVLVITIGKHDATVVEATVTPEVLADLIKNPEGMGKAITDEVATSDP